MSQEVPQLHCPDAGFQLPTADPQSLSTLTYLKMCGVKFQTQHSAALPSEAEPPLLRSIPSHLRASKEHQQHQDRTQQSVLPVLHVAHVSRCGFDRIVKFCASQDFDLDAKRSTEQRGEIQVFENLIEEKLYPVMGWWWWCNGLNYPQVKRQCFGKAGLLNRHFLPYMYARQMKSICKRYGIESREQCLARAKEGFEALNTLFSARHKYVFDNAPSALDALVFGIMACILVPTESDIPDRGLAELLLDYEHLCRLVNQVMEEYFGEHVVGGGEGMSTESVQKEKVNAEAERRKQTDLEESEKAQTKGYRSRKLWFWALLAFAGSIWAYANRQHFYIMALQAAGGELRVATDDEGQNYHMELVLPMEDTEYSSSHNEELVR